MLVIQKIYSNRFYATALKILITIKKNHTLYDIDDAEYLRHSPKSLQFFMKKCTAVSVGSKVLENYAHQFNSNVFLNTSPVINHSYLKKSLADKFTIGWVGDYGNGNPLSYEFSHKRALNELIFPIFKKLNTPVRLVLIGITRMKDILAIKAYFDKLKNVELIIPENIDWTNENWLYNEICKFDVGLAPLIEHEFNRAKSAYKVKEYLSCGIPALASITGENASFVNHGINGFICDSQDDYEKQIRHFTSMGKDEYFKMSSNAYSNSQLFRTEKYCDDLIHYLLMIN